MTLSSNTTLVLLNSLCCKGHSRHWQICRFETVLDVTLLSTTLPKPTTTSVLTACCWLRLDCELGLNPWHEVKHKFSHYLHYKNLRTPFYLYLCSTSGTITQCTIFYSPILLQALCFIMILRSHIPDVQNTWPLPVFLRDCHVYPLNSSTSLSMHFHFP